MSFLSILIVSFSAFSNPFIDSTIWTSNPETTLEDVEKASCLTYLSANLELTENGIDMRMSNQLAGYCDLFVYPDNRKAELTLTEAGDFCSPDVYTGSVEYLDGPAPTKPVKVTVRDYRVMLCEILMIAPVTVEFDRGAETTSVYYPVTH